MGKDRILVLTNGGDEISEVCQHIEDEYEIIIAQRPDEAEKILERASEVISLIIIDSKVDLQESVSFCSMASKKNWMNNLPVLLVIEKFDEEYVDRLFKYNVDDILPMPLNQTVVKNRISNFIKIYKDKRQLKISSIRAEQARHEAEAAAKNLRRKTQVVQILGSIYACVVYVNVEQGRYLTMDCAPHVLKIIGPEGYADDRIVEAAKMFSSDEERDNVVEFATCSTLRERMKGKDMISMDFNGSVSGIVRASIVAADRNIDGDVVHAIYILQNLGEEKITLPEEMD